MIQINNIEYNKKSKTVSILRSIIFSLIIEIGIVAIYIATKKNKILLFGTLINIICTTLYVCYLALMPINSSMHYTLSQLLKVLKRLIEKDVEDKLLPANCKK